jgi:uncharacterized integral membrane protein
VLLLAGAIFALENAQAVTVRFLLWQLGGWRADRETDQH